MPSEHSSQPSPDPELERTDRGSLMGIAAGLAIGETINHFMAGDATVRQVLSHPGNLSLASLKIHQITRYLSIDVMSGMLGYATGAVAINALPDWWIDLPNRLANKYTQSGEVIPEELLKGWM